MHGDIILRPIRDLYFLPSPYFFMDACDLYPPPNIDSAPRIPQWHTMLHVNAGKVLFSIVYLQATL